MKTTSTQKHTRLALSCALALSVMSGAALSQTAPSGHGYLVNTEGQAWKNAAGECWDAGFESTPGSRAQCEPVPAPRAAVAEPVEFAQMAPAPVAMTLGASTLFAFDSATLRPEGRTELDQFARELRNMEPESVTIVGHTDRLGAPDYNQRLSEQRAEAVKAYLVSQGIDANRIRATGKGHTQPVTASTDCSGPRSDRVINCLQPDRRVELQASGTRIER
jgi:OmpA-OmpF porin, OOP family